MELVQAIGQMMEEKLQQELIPIRAEISDMKAKQDALYADVAHLNHEVLPTLKVIKDGMEGLQERYNRLDRTESRQEEHGHRIFALEQAVAHK